MPLLLMMIAVVLYAKWRHYQDSSPSDSLVIGDTHIVYTCGCHVAIDGGGARHLEATCWAHHGMTLEDIYAEDKAERDERRAIKTAERRAKREAKAAVAAVERAEAILKKGRLKEAAKAKAVAEKLMDKAKAAAEKYNRVRNNP